MEDKKSQKKFSLEVIEYFNMARTNPKKFAEIIKEIKTYFKGKILRLPGSSVGIMTKEGADAFEEAANFLEKEAKPVCELKYNTGLAHIAQDVVEEAQKADDLNTLDDLDMDKIFDKYGRFTGSFSRAMDFGSKDPRMVVVNLVVSDGDKNRGQREGIFNGDLKEIGVWTGKEKTYGQCTSIASATKFIVKDGVKDDLDVQKEELKTITQKLKSTKPPSKETEEEDMELPPGVKSIDKSEKIVVENGKKKRITKIVKHMEDGSTETETTKETVDE